MGSANRGGEVDHGVHAVAGSAEGREVSDVELDERLPLVQRGVAVAAALEAVLRLGHRQQVRQPQLVPVACRQQVRTVRVGIIAGGASTVQRGGGTAVKREVSPQKRRHWPPTKPVAPVSSTFFLSRGIGF